MALEPKFKKFADQYLATNKISASAIAAGYSPRSAHVSGNRLLKRPDVQQYIASVVAKQTAPSELLGDQVIAELKALAFANIADLITIDADGRPSFDLSNATREQLSAISNLKTKQSRRYDAKGKHIATDTEVAVAMSDKLRGLELLGKHAGLFKTEEQRVVVDVADRLLNARSRLARANLLTDNGNSSSGGGGG